MKWTLRLALLGICGALTLGCASSVDKDLDDARKALNDGNWAKAITSATAATAAEPTNLEAFLLLCSGYAGQAGVDLLEITKELTDTTTSNDSFDLVHDTLLTTMTSEGCVIGTCLTDLNTSITTLTTSFTGTVGTYDAYLQKQYYFQLGILQYIQALGLPTLTAQPTHAGTITPTDVTAAINTTTQTDFIAGYANLTNSTTGIATSNALATILSKNYCALKAESVIAGTASGLNLGVLQAFTLCQLSTTPATEATVVLAPTVANCAVFTTQLDSAACSPGTTAPAL